MTKERTNDPPNDAGGEMAVELENIVKRFGAVEALSGVSLTIRRGEFFSLLGPSGCGKTTLLRIIGGLEEPDEGVVRIAGADARDIPAHRRPVNTVFQHYALFPHMTVRENIAFGLVMKKMGKAEIATRVAKAMDMAQIAGVADRKPDQLSGGQKQRVALARAIVNEPQALLMDEPLGSLDLKLRKELQIELTTLQKRLGTTFICVTHDQEEALSMSDRIAVMNFGKIEQVGDARFIYERPRTRFAAQFLGSCNLIDAKAKTRDSSGALVSTAVGDLRVDFGSAPPQASRKETFTLAIRPEKARISIPAESRGDNMIMARVSKLIYVGAETHYLLDAGGLALRVEMMNTGAVSRQFGVGDEVAAHLPPTDLIALDD